MKSEQKLKQSCFTRMMTLPFLIACSHAKLNGHGNLLTFRLVFLQNITSRRTSSSMNISPIFFTAYKLTFCFQDVCLKKLLSGFLFCIYFGEWFFFFTSRILKVFIANSTKYSSAYYSKNHTDTGNQSFSLKFSTGLSRLQNSEVYNNCQDCQR